MGRHKSDQLESRFLLINKNGVVTNIIDNREEAEKHSGLVYSVKVQMNDDNEEIIMRDACLVMEFLPTHESWKTGAWPDKQYNVPSVIVELEIGMRLRDVMSKFLSGDMKCPKCGKSCSSMSGFTLHTKNCNATPKSENGVIYSCSICGKKTISKFGLTNHMKAFHLNVVGIGANNAVE